MNDADKATERKPISAAVVYKAIVDEGKEELSRSSGALALSGLAAGLSIGFSFITQAALASHLPNTEWAPLVTKFGYVVGFLIVILGRQQFFTEDTLIPVLPLLDRDVDVRVYDVARLWTIVLFTNLVGAAAFAFAVANLSFFGSDMQESFHAIGNRVFQRPPSEVFVGAILAGWLVALIAWMQPAAHTSKVTVIIIMAYVIGIAELPHIVAGSVDVFYMIAQDRRSFGEYVTHFMLPVLSGNVLGGLGLVTIFKYGEMAADKRRRPS